MTISPLTAAQPSAQPHRRQVLLNKHMSGLVFEDMEEREARIGLTVGIDFNSKYVQMKAELERRALEITAVTIQYSGKVPLN